MSSPDEYPDTLAPEEVQELMARAVRAYGRLLDAGVAVSPLPPGADITATDAVRAASGILKAVNLETFELALWETWGGTPWTVVR